MYCRILAWTRLETTTIGGQLFTWMTRHKDVRTRSKNNDTHHLILTHDSWWTNVAITVRDRFGLYESRYLPTNSLTLRSKLVFDHRFDQNILWNILACNSLIIIFLTLICYKNMNFLPFLFHDFFEDKIFCQLHVCSLYVRVYRS